MKTNTMNIPTEKQYFSLEKEITKLLKSLKHDIGDEYRCTDDSDDNTPGMLVTIGATPNEDGDLIWGYQTGDNSYTGAAYSHRNWGVGYLYRRSHSGEVAHGIVEEIAESIAQSEA